ncbi:MmgE/PrpD family protein [Pseudomonas daroniae]|uniref:MmgE/PrpD family protein n=1 Tax=Phytopseudomonas daroniae TaxID=2487519 RepID=A0A4V2KAP3_9GAMM|nr:MULTISPECIES: MmgE/PrpD family protein [Pseudomonas]TBU79326.1 MmgE/PrpD family protein [Pseudomonas daroniae]TBU80108.1 MmgE/PrpD family protein [Pseudomonas sp. FRB 228]TBU91426.1 MmgE/PrpD family protein [Pseudomonas daroniae]
MGDITLAKRIARYAYEFPITGYPDDLTTTVRNRLLDSLACIVGAYGAEPVQASVAYAASVRSGEAGVFGTFLKTTPECAAFANGVMVRFLDYNDGYMGLEPGHPSDNIPACLAVAQAEKAGGRELIAAILLAYEIQMRLQDAASLNRKGWDHVNYINVSMAVAAAKLMKLTEQQIEQAINISLGGHLAMRQVRSGTLSDWKGCSAANAARNAIFSAQMARHGMTGPSPIFEGEMGFHKQVTGDFSLDVASFGSLINDDFAIRRSLTKTFPTNGELHTAVWAGIELSQRIGDISAVDSIRIETSEFNKRVLADGVDKWRPRTRETADHSLPYNVARALIDADISVESYSLEKITDPLVTRLMERTTVTEDPVLTQLFPNHLANRVIVKLRSGEALVSEVITGPGSVETPMTEADFENKFRKMAAPHLGKGAQQGVLAFVSTLDQQSGYDALFAAMARAAKDACP